MSHQAPHLDPDDFYEPYAAACFNYMSRTFQCSATIYSETSRKILVFQDFILHILRRGRLPPDVACTALFLLHRLKLKYPAAVSPRDGSPVFVAALILAHKALQDESYGVSSWATMTQGIMAIRNINQYERELLAHLEFETHIRPKELKGFARFKQEIDWPDQEPLSPSTTVAEASDSDERPTSVLEVAKEAYDAQPFIPPNPLDEVESIPGPGSSRLYLISTPQASSISLDSGGAKAGPRSTLPHAGRPPVQRMHTDPPALGESRLARATSNPSLASAMTFSPTFFARLSEHHARVTRSAGQSPQDPTRRPLAHGGHSSLGNMNGSIRRPTYGERAMTWSAPNGAPATVLPSLGNEEVADQLIVESRKDEEDSDVIRAYGAPTRW